MNMKPVTWSVLALLLGTGAIAQAQQDADTDEAPEQKPVDEIVVTGSRDGDQEEFDPRSEAVLRERVFAEFRQLREEEEDAEFRASLPEPIEGPSGMRWGYDPQAEMRMRRESALIELQQDYPRPATVLKIEF